MLLNESAEKIATNLLAKKGSKQNSLIHKQLISKVLKTNGIPVYTKWPLKLINDEYSAIIPPKDKDISAFSGPDGKDRDVVILRKHKAVVCELKYFPSEVSGGNQDKSFKDLKEIHGKTWNAGEYSCIGLGICDGVHHLTKNNDAGYRLARQFESSMTILQRSKELLK
jgi:hypothetical protein